MSTTDSHDESGFENNPGEVTAENTITGASEVDGPAGEDGTYGNVDRATAGSLDGTPDETS